MPDGMERRSVSRSASRTSAKRGPSPGPVINCNRNCTSITADCARVATLASSARKTPGPVERLEQPDRPGSHHQTPLGSFGSTAMHSPRGPTPTSIGAAVTTYRGTNRVSVDRHPMRPSVRSAAIKTKRMCPITSAILTPAARCRKGSEYCPHASLHEPYDAQIQRQPECEPPILAAASDGNDRTGQGGEHDNLKYQAAIVIVGRPRLTGPRKKISCGDRTDAQEAKLVDLAARCPGSR